MEKTISQLELENYDGIECRCFGCRKKVIVPFRMIREKIPTLSGWTIEELGKKMKCRDCGKRPSDPKPWRQEDQQGVAKNFYYPKYT